MGEECIKTTIKPDRSLEEILRLSTAAYDRAMDLYRLTTKFAEFTFPSPATAKADEDRPEFYPPTQEIIDRLKDTLATLGEALEIGGQAFTDLQGVADHSRPK